LITSTRSAARFAALTLLVGALQGPACLRLSGQSVPDGEAAAPRAGSSGVSGVVRSRFEGGVRPLPSALVEIAARGGVRSVQTDEAGRYSVTDLAPGPVRVRATHPGHADVTVSAVLVTGRTLELDLELALVPVELDGLDIVSGRTPEVGDAEVTDPSLRSDPRLALEMLEVGPGFAETGLAGAISTLPGNDPTDPSDVLFMRGSATEMKLVLLDGVPVVTPFQVGGLLRSFEPGLLGHARFHIGGAPARYDGGLTHILDLRTRSARRDRVRATGSVDLLSSTIAAEIPLGRQAGLLAAGRRLHDPGRTPLGGPQPYGYGDALVSFEADPGAGQRVHAMGFWNSESVRLDWGDGPARAEWGNLAGSLGWDGRAGGVALSLSLGGSRYDALLPLSPTPTEENPDPSDILAAARTERLRAVAEARFGDPTTPLRAGLTFEEIGAGLSAEFVDNGARAAHEGRRAVAGGYVDVVREVAPGVHLRGGLRADVFDGDAPRLSPRLSLSWALGPTALLTVAGGRFHQVVQGLVSEPVARPETVLSGTLLPVARADHLVLSLDQELGESVALGLGGYWKRYEGTHLREDRPILNSGLDVRVRTGGDRAAAWLGYELSWFWSAGSSYAFSNDFAGRHLLSAGASGAVAGPIRAEVTLAYGAGLPSTGLPFGSVEDAGLSAGPGLETLGGEQLSGGSVDPRVGAPPPDESFLRIDLELHADFEPEWANHRWRIRPYVRLLNPLDTRDALFYAYRPRSDGGATPLVTRPVLPVFGIAVSY
jgi:hypothetical protein